MKLVAGIDSSPPSCKVMIRDAETGKLVRQGRASHPDGTEVHPDAWWSALRQAIDEAGGLDDVAAASVAGQQHGMVVLDSGGEVVRPALLWNDTRSAGAAAELIEDLGGGDAGPRARGRRPPGLGRRRRDRAGGQLHPDQAALAGPQRAGRGRAGRGGLPAARLA